MANLEDVQDLIQEILGNPKLKYVADRLRQEYHDEPILQTASQMQRLLPRPLVEAKRLMRNPAEYHYSYRQLFYQQAKLLEDFTDDFSEQASFASDSFAPISHGEPKCGRALWKALLPATRNSTAMSCCTRSAYQIRKPDSACYSSSGRTIPQFRRNAASPISRYGSMTTSFTTD